MPQTQAQKIFEKYNPTDDVRRCPNGRSAVRKLLDTYAKAAVNLYGVISQKELAEIFNLQNSEQTNAEEIYLLLLPLVLKSKWYGFYKDYIVHYWAFEDFGLADYLLREQEGKPRYVPAEDEFLKFAAPYYENNPQRDSWRKVQDFFDKTWPGNFKRYRCYHELKDYIPVSTGVQGIGEILEKHGVVFENDTEMEAFFTLLFEAKNNTRIWENNGYTPAEMYRLMEISRPQREAGDAVQVHIPKKVGPNAPCPCGSGKKYKKCCSLVDSARTAQLSHSERDLFYETWYGLMGYVNAQKKVINAVIKPKYPNAVSDEQIYKVREVLWENPGLIDDYLQATELPREKVELLASWRRHYRKDMFFLVEYLPEYAVAIGSNDQQEDRLYGIKGISQSVANAMKRQLPIQIETVLLPFKDMIIYDSFMTSMPLSFGEDARKMFREMYDKALVHGIITRLE